MVRDQAKHCYWTFEHQQPDINKIYLYIEDPFESNYQLLNNGREKLGIKKLKDLKVIFHYSQTIDDVSEDLKDYNPIKKRKVLIVFDDMIAVWKPIKN